MDSDGNAYVAGYTVSSDFPITAGAVQSTSGGGGDAFVTKLNPTGTALVYSTYLGGSSGDAAEGLAVDSAGNVYVAGSTSSTDFPTTAGGIKTVGNGDFGDAFVTKIRPPDVPAAAILLAPTGPLATPTPTFTWTAVAEAEQYYLWVQDNSGLKVSQWYTAAEVGCGSGSGSCSVQPNIPLSAGTVTWRVRTWNSEGYGPYAGPWTFTVSGPSAATLLSPSGMVGTPTPAYTWQAVSTADQYYLNVQDSTGLKVSQWYTAAQVGCGSGGGTCSVTPSITLATGSASWRVRTWNSLGYGAYSGIWIFTVSAPPATTLLAPTGTSAPVSTYSWQAVSTADQYYLNVQDSTGLKVSQWYTAAQVGCGSGGGTCSVTPSITLATGSASWRVRTWNAIGYGPYAGPGTGERPPSHDPPQSQRDRDYRDAHVLLASGRDCRAVLPLGPG